jgi:alginate O-acetyltransferase complex protein AlgI
MVFTTHLFVFYFLPFVLLLYYSISHQRYRLLLLATMSYCFYAWANPPWALIMFFSTVQDYVCGVFLYKLSGLPMEGDEYPVLPRDHPRTFGQRVALTCSIIGNLAVLGFFKYYDFTADNLNRVAGGLGLGADWVPILQIALPVGVSFYTFQSMSYAIDVYRGDARPMRGLVNFICFETFFPHLVAGPIVRYADLAEQMRHRTHTYEKFARGVAFFACGMAKKLLIANPLAPIADTAFAANHLYWYDAWFGVAAYAFQIYFDFSGYSDIAVGLGLMFGFLVRENFISPYRAQSITEFWRRWHISLSSWLRDYLYIPLGGNRRSEVRTYANLMVVMLLGGFWHGASWNFVIWGAIHGSMLAFERWCGKDAFYRRLPMAVRTGLTFAIVCIAWVFFRAPTLPGALSFLRAMFGDPSALGGHNLVRRELYDPVGVIVLACAAVLVWQAPRTWRFTQNLTVERAWACMLMLAMAILAMWSQSVNPFLYFQF